MAAKHRAIGLFEWAYGGMGLALIGWAGSALPTAWYPATGLWVAIVAALTPFSIRLYDPVKLPGAMAVEMTVLLVAPAPVSVLVAASTNLFTSIRYRRPWHRTLFNIGNLAGPNALAAALLSLAVGPGPRELILPDHLLAVVAAIVVRMITNLLGSAGLQTLEGRVRFWPYVSDSLLDEVTNGGFSIRFLPVLMALAYPRAGWWVFVLGGGVQAAIGASMQRYQERIDRQTLVDGLTHVGSRKAWEQHRRAYQPPAPHLLAVVDVDGLKFTNDTYGHDQGDAILMDLAQRLEAAAQGGQVFRMGGDEFIISLPGVTHASPARSAVEAAVEQYSRHWQAQGYPVSASAGFAECPADADDLNGAFSLADRRMYQAKAARRTQPAVPS